MCAVGSCASGPAGVAPSSESFQGQPEHLEASCSWILNVKVNCGTSRKEEEDCAGLLLELQIL